MFIVMVGTFAACLAGKFRRCAVFIVVPYHLTTTTTKRCVWLRNAPKMARIRRRTYYGSKKNEFMRRYASTGSSIVNELAAVCSFRIFSMVFAGFMDTPDIVIDSSCEMTGWLPLAVIQ